jgi:hypothetical protein
MERQVPINELKPGDRVRVHLDADGFHPTDWIGSTPIEATVIGRHSHDREVLLGWKSDVGSRLRNATTVENGGWKVHRSKDTPNLEDYTHGAWLRYNQRTTHCTVISSSPKISLKDANLGDVVKVWTDGHGNEGSKEIEATVVAMNGSNEHARKNVMLGWKTKPKGVAFEKWEGTFGSAFKDFIPNRANYTYAAGVNQDCECEIITPAPKPTKHISDTKLGDRVRVYISGGIPSKCITDIYVDGVVVGMMANQSDDRLIGFTTQFSPHSFAILNDSPSAGCVYEKMVPNKMDFKWVHGCNGDVACDILPAIEQPKQEPKKEPIKPVHKIKDAKLGDIINIHVSPGSHILAAKRSEYTNEFEARVIAVAKNKRSKKPIMLGFVEGQDVPHGTFIQDENKRSWGYYDYLKTDELYPIHYPKAICVSGEEECVMVARKTYTPPEEPKQETTPVPVEESKASEIQEPEETNASLSVGIALAGLAGAMLTGITGLGKNIPAARIATKDAASEDNIELEPSKEMNASM